jgi:hypothetical protein
MHSVIDHVQKFHFQCTALTPDRNNNPNSIAIEGGKSAAES